MEGDVETEFLETKHLTFTLCPCCQHRPVPRTAPSYLPGPVCKDCQKALSELLEID